MKSLRLCGLTVFAVIVTSLAAWAGDPGGTWKFKAEGPKGRAVDSTLTLQWNGSQLTGRIDSHVGQAQISAGSFVGEQVKFTVVRTIRRRELTVQYVGRLEGDTITGTIQTAGREGKPISIPWVATRNP